MLTDMRVLEARVEFTDEHLRTPLKFGTGVVSAVTGATVTVLVETRGGRRAEGRGNILLSDLWAYPSSLVPHETRDSAMRAVAERSCRIAATSDGHAHPMDAFLTLKPEIEAAAASVSREMVLAEPVPELAWLVASSPLDAALHDAFGQANGICSYDGYGPDFMSHDLSRWLGTPFVSRYPRDYLSPAPVARLPVFHLVGGVDKLAEAEVDDTDPADGLPVSLDQWIQRDGVYCLKVKLRGTDVPWDVERTKAVYTTAVATRRSLGLNERVYLSVDSNEMHSGPDAVVEYLERLRKTSPDAYDSLLYLEQPTERDLDAHSYDMRPVAALKPVIVDEGVTGTDSLARARSLGWSGIALKTCKGHSASLLYAAVAREYGMPVTVQDLTNPGLSFVHSAGLAARVSPIMGVEYNSRQYLPDASPDARSRHTGLFTTLDGQISTASISIRGLGY